MDLNERFFFFKIEMVSDIKTQGIQLNINKITQKRALGMGKSPDTLFYRLNDQTPYCEHQPELLYSSEYIKTAVRT